MELLHRGIENFLDHARQAVHLVDEQNGAVLEVREDRRQVTSALYRWAARDLYRNSKLVRDHVRE